MAKRQELTYYIDNDGTIRFELNGFEGKGCHEMQQKLQEAMGGQITELTYTSDYNKIPTCKVDRTQLA